MTNPSDTPSVTLPPQAANVSPETIVVAKRYVRAKTFLKTSFKNIGTPVVAGAAGGLVAIAAVRKRNDEDDDTVDTSETD